MRQALSGYGRRPVARTAAQNRTATRTFLSPFRGLVTAENLAKPIPESAIVLHNWFPTIRGPRVRGGSTLFATIGSDDVTAMWTYQTAGAAKLFAANAGAIYDITAPADPEVVPTPAVGSLSGGYWSFVQFETSAGDFLVGVNGADTPRQYNGTSWLSSTMSGSGLTPSDLGHVWAYKKRLYFIEEGTMKFWYLGAGAITGTLTDFNLGGVFQRGGSLLFGATWSLDAGDGLDDKLVLVSTLGEVAIYEGSDPASDFSLVGRYDISQPLGKNAVMRAGGDLLVATVEGLIPISQAVNKDPAALSLTAVSRLIEPDWVAASAERSSVPWDIVRWDSANLAFICMPTPSAASEALSFVVNVETGAWATVGEWNMHVGATVGSTLYFGNGSGQIFIGDAGGSDNGALYTCQYAGPFAPVGPLGPEKLATLARAFFRSSKNFVAQLSLSTDYRTSFPPAPSSVGNASASEWDTGLWDEAVWDEAGSADVRLKWVSVTGMGDVFSPQVQMSFGTNFKPDVELSKFQLEAELGRRVA